MSSREDAPKFYMAYTLLIALDVGLLIWHFTVFVGAWHEGLPEEMTALAFGATHFLTNTIAIADLFMHLGIYIHDRECAFECAKSTNCFLFSTIGVYADLIAAALDNVSEGPHHWYTVSLYWSMVAQSAMCSMLSVLLYVWGSRLAQYCEAPARVSKPTSTTMMLK